MSLPIPEKFHDLFSQANPVWLNHRQPGWTTSQRAGLVRFRRRARPGQYACRDQESPESYRPIPRLSLLGDRSWGTLSLD